MKRQTLAFIFLFLLYTTHVTSNTWGLNSIGIKSASNQASTSQNSAAPNAQAGSLKPSYTNYGFSQGSIGTSNGNKTSVPEPTVNPKPAAQPTPAPQPVAQPTPTPQPVAQPNPKPTAQPTPAPQPVAQPNPKPASQSTSVSQPSPQEISTLKCQPFQVQKNGKCQCNDQNCNKWKSSHLCTSQTQNGECVCSDNLCNKNDKSCSSLNITGECVECREQTQSIDCQDHQICHKNACVCSDTKCKKDGLVCEREYSKNSECVKCRKDQQCGPTQRCTDQGICVCSKLKCQQRGLHCLDSNIFAECVICNQNVDCEDFQICTANKECICANEECPQGTFCDSQTAQGVCQQCFEDADCDQSFQECIGKKCVCVNEKCGQLFGGSCTTEDEIGRCSECTGNQECLNPDQICVAGRCLCTDTNCLAQYPGTLQFCLDLEDGPCVQCRRDEHCDDPNVQSCSDDGVCECSDDKCADQDSVCGPAGTCVECTTANQRFCQQYESCDVATNVCECDPTQCPECTPMCQPISGVCVECLANSDCDQTFQTCSNTFECACVDDLCAKIDPDATCSGADCVECTSDVACTVDGEECIGGFCVCQDANCLGTNICASQNTGPCVQCRTADDCISIETCNDEGACVDDCDQRVNQGIQVTLNPYSSRNRSVGSIIDFELIIVQQLTNGTTNILTNFENLDEYNGKSFLSFTAAPFKTRGQGFVSSGDFPSRDQTFRYYNVFNEDLRPGEYTIYFHPEDCYQANLSNIPRPPTNPCAQGIQRGTFQIMAGFQSFQLQYTFNRTPTVNVIDIALITVTANQEAQNLCGFPVFDFSIENLSEPSDFAIITPP